MHQLRLFTFSARSMMRPLLMSRILRQIAQAQSEERTLVNELEVAGKREALLLGLQVRWRGHACSDVNKLWKPSRVLFVFVPLFFGF
jgi:hypothetical protein